MVALAIVKMEDLFAVVMLAGIYSLLSACFFVLQDAVDVAFTEAAVGAGISTLLMFVAITMTGRSEDPVKHKPLLAFMVVLVTGAFLIYGTLDMPHFGSPDAPVQQHVGPYYIENTMRDIGVLNMVAAVLASYRGFDTFGEVVVIFTAGMGVLALLSVTRRRDEVVSESDADRATLYDKHLVLQIVTKLTIPFILLYALYVQFHGDFGPGGGFQAGVVFASAIFLYAMSYGLQATRKFINPSFIRFIAAVGVLLYGSVGVVSMLNGGNFLDYSVLADDPIAGQHLGILGIELGVGLTVASIMMVIFLNFSARKERHRQAQEKEASQ